MLNVYGDVVTELPSVGRITPSSIKRVVPDLIKTKADTILQLDTILVNRLTGESEIKSQTFIQSVTCSAAPVSILF